MAKVTPQQQKNFIEYIAPIIKEVGNSRGYLIVSPFIAMACKEGNFGESSLAKKYANHFGMKAGKSWKGKVVNLKTQEEYTVGVLTTIVDGFRVYEGVTKEQADINGVNGFFDFISTKRYSKVKDATTPLGVVTELKKAGYMTSSTYVNSIMNDYINRFDLTRYDNISYPTKNEDTKPVNYPTLSLGKSDKQLGGNYIESWQRYLNTLGMYNGQFDGIFGTRTHFAVRQYQEAKGLKVDGVVGKATWATIPRG